ncbi:MAG: hypothetical protein R3C24_12545 [Cyanobacteriota/Melainabacteria group bacterium]
MSSKNFFATPDDFAKVLDFAIEIGFTLYPYGSALGEEVQAFADTEAAMNYYWKDVFPRSFIVKLWHPDMKAEPIFQRHDYPKDNSFRYVVVGWGLIQLDLGLSNSLSKYVRRSEFGHNSESRALLWEANYHDRLGDAAAWDWKAIEKLSGKLKYHINKKLVVEESRFLGVLPGAAQLRKEGYKLMLN